MGVGSMEGSGCGKYRGKWVWPWIVGVAMESGCSRG